MVGDSELSRAKELADRAEHEPETLTTEDAVELTALLTGNYQEARLEAAGAFEHLCGRPELFEPVASDLAEFAAYHPRWVDDIPAPVEVFGNEDLQEVLYVADAMARAARNDPQSLLPAVDKLVEAVRSDRNSPGYHLFTLGAVAGEFPDRVPAETVVERLVALLDTPTHGYDGWAADTLRQVGDPSVLPALREHRPEKSDESTVEAFEDAIEALERAG